MEAIIKTALKPNDIAKITAKIEPKTEAQPFTAQTHGIKADEISLTNVITKGKNIPIKYPGNDKSRKSIITLIRIVSPQKYSKIWLIKIADIITETDKLNAMMYRFFFEYIIILPDV